MTVRQVVLDEIVRERQYQDKKWGTILDNPREVGQWLRIMMRELDEARTAYWAHRDRDALAEIQQVAAVAVACLEQHGIVPRESEIASLYPYISENITVWAPESITLADVLGIIRRYGYDNDTLMPEQCEINKIPYKIEIFVTKR